MLVIEKMLLVVFFTVPYVVLCDYIANNNQISTKAIEELAEDLESEQNSMLAVEDKDEYDIYSEFYDDQDNWLREEDSMNVLFFGPSDSFLRIDPESILHILIYTKKYLIPISRVLLAWDVVTDGKTATYLRGREFLAFGSLLNVVPEEDLYYVNFGDPTVLSYFAKQDIKLQMTKYGVLVSAYKRVFGNKWYANSTLINQLGYLFCAFADSDFRKIRPETFKEINSDVLTKILKCSMKQKRILYDIAVHHNAYGSPYKWTKHDLMKIGFLVSFIPNDELCSIQLSAMKGISEDVMKYIDQSKLPYFSKKQVMRMSPKTRRIFILRMQLKNSVDIHQLLNRNVAFCQSTPMFLVFMYSFISMLVN